MQFIKGVLALLSKSIDMVIKLVGIMGLIWGISTIYEIFSSLGGTNAMSFEKALWSFGTVALLAVFVFSFAYYTYMYFRVKPRIRIRTTEERINDLEHDLKLIKDSKVKKEDIMRFESGK